MHRPEDFFRGFYIPQSIKKRCYKSVAPVCVVHQREREKEKREEDTEKKSFDAYYCGVTVVVTTV
jgi:hypothetical protein